MRVIKPPQKIPLKKGRLAVFLAGTIDQGNSIDWQTKIIEQLIPIDPFMDIYNPRRDEWDASWEQTTDNPNFVEQVNWELDGIEVADVVYIYFAPESQSPISLLELGLVAERAHIVVCCPKGFWRKGNIDIVCRRHNIPVLETFEELEQDIIDLAKAYVVFNQALSV